MTLTKIETATYLYAQDRFAIITHRRPDGDTIGSAAALCLGLRQIGKSAYVIENPEITERYRFLVEGLTKPQPEEGDCLVCVDVASENMLPEVLRPLAGKIQLRIDHHSTGKSFTQRELVDASSASCAEIIWDLFHQMRLQMRSDMATAVYVGLATDTGCFRYANTNARCFSVAAVCAKAGADLFALNQRLFETTTVAKVNMQAWIAQHLRTLPGGLTLCAIPKSVEEKLGVDEDDMDNMSAFLRSLEGARMSAMLREVSEGVKVSIRAVPELDASKVAKALGGGGHRGAAGATLDTTLGRAAKQVELQMRLAADIGEK